MLSYFNKMTGSKPEQPDSPPKNLYVGAINPFALIEATLGRKLDWHDAATLRMLSSILQTDYEELFDMRFDSVLYAGIRLTESHDRAELIPAKEMHTLTERDLVTPDFSKVEKLGDLGRLGLKDLNEIRVKHAFMSNGNLRLTLEPQAVGKTLSNSEMTTTLRELCTPFRIHEKEKWTPPNGTWIDFACYRHDATVFSNPVQGATANSWFVAALMSVFWSDPAVIQHCSRPSPAGGEHGGGGGGGEKTKECSLSIKFYKKGGDRDADTATVKVNCELPANNSSSLLMYCRPSAMVAKPHIIPKNIMGISPLGAAIGEAAAAAARGFELGGEMWPSLYEKAFAKWITRASESEQHPDLTQTSHGDPVKAMAQLTDREPQYYFTSSRSAADLLGLVRTHSVNLRTIYPTVAFTHPTGDKYRGCTLVGNLAYSVLGWSAPQERKQYIILRHPWGVTEPEGMTSYPGLVHAIDTKFWHPIDMVDRAGVFAIETSAFKEYFAGLGVAK